MLFDLGATPPDSTSYEYAEANAAYASGQVAAMVQWNAAASELTAARPPPAPRPRPQDRKASSPISTALAWVEQGGRKQEGAIAFLQWLSTEEAALDYAKAGGAPGLAAETAAKLAADRPDLVQVGEYASTYGFVMNGGTSEKALSVYEAQAKEFTGFWAGTQDLDTAMKNAATAMPSF